MQWSVGIEGLEVWNVSVGGARAGPRGVWTGGGPFSVAVGVVEGSLLVALPAAAWHRKKARRRIAADALRRVVNADVVAGDLEDRTVPDRECSIGVVLGLLKAELEDEISYGVAELDIGFPMDSLGLMRSPFAEGLVEISKDHFTFFSAESAVPRPPRLGAGGGRATGVEQRLQALEAGIQSIEAGLSRLLPGQDESAVGRKAKAAPKRPSKKDSSWSCGPVTIPTSFDGRCIPRSLSRDGGCTWSSSSSEAGRAAASRRAVQRGGRGGWSRWRRIWIPRSACQGSHISQQDRQGPPARQSEEERPGFREHSGPSRIWLSKGLCYIYSEQSCGTQIPTAIARTGPEADLFCNGTSSPRRLGIGFSAARHQLFKHQCKRVAGAQIADTELSKYHPKCLDHWRDLGLPPNRKGRGGESKGGIGGRDAGSAELRPGELVTGIRAFARTSSPLLQLPHTRLIDGRWFELILSRLKDLAEFQEKKMKLSSGPSRTRAEDPPVKPEPKVKAKVKASPKGGSGKGSGKKGGEEPPLESA